MKNGPFEDSVSYWKIGDFAGNFNRATFSIGAGWLWEHDLGLTLWEADFFGAPRREKTREERWWFEVWNTWTFQMSKMSAFWLILWVIVGTNFTHLEDPGIFSFHPYLRNWSNLANMFEIGWNHHLAKRLNFWDRLKLCINSIVFCLRYQIS